VVADLAEGGPFFLHRAVAAVGDSRRGDQPEEDPDRGVDVDAGDAAGIAGRVDDPVEDQQDRDPAEDRDGGVERERRLEDRVAMRITATATAARMTIIRMMSIVLNASQALPPMLRLKSPLPPLTSTLNQSKNMKMKRRTADPPAIFSPVLSLSITILPPR
jgi:hypothetical protein